MDLILRLRVGRAVHQLFFVDVTVFMREQSEKREVRKSSTTTEQETTPKSWSQTVQTTRPGCQTDRSKLHTPPAARAMINSPIEQKLQFSVCKTTRRFAGLSLLSCVLQPSFTKICIRISLCKTSLLWPDVRDLREQSPFFSRKQKNKLKESFCSRFFSFFLHFSSCFWRRVPRLAPSYWPILVKQILNQWMNLKKRVFILFRPNQTGDSAETVKPQGNPALYKHWNSSH